VDENDLRQHIEFLSSRLPDRRSNTENERAAAEFLLERFKRYTPHTEIDDFYSIDTFAYLFASYYVEFLIVALLASWSPWFGLVYGLVVFMVYTAEFTGYPMMSRLFPQFETQNVVARFFGAAPKRLLVVTANYDSPKASLLTLPKRAPWLAKAHLLLVVCMVVVVLSCASEGAGFLQAYGLLTDVWLRWGAVAILLTAATALYLSENQSEPVRGANGNASGTAVLVSLAESLQQHALASTDVMLIATGSKETWLSGMQHLLTMLGDDHPSTVYFINVSNVGGAKLRYVRGEGMMHIFPSAKELVRIAEAEAPAYGATPLTYRGLPTDALAPMVRGFKTLGIMGATDQGLPLNWSWHSDTAANIDFAVLSKACGYVDAIVRRLDASDEL